MKLLVASLLSAVLFGCAHPQPKETVEPVSQQWLEENAGTHNHDVLNCYSKRLKAGAKIEGELILEFTATDKGEMSDLKIAKSIDPEIDRCVYGEAKAWKYPWNVRKGGDDLQMRDTFHLKREDGVPRVSFEEIQIGDSHTAIHQVINDHIGEVRECYADRMKSHPAESVKIVLEWDIDEHGNVKAPHAKRSHDRDLEECLIAKLKTWKFPVPPKNMVSRVDFPFVFDSGGSANE